MSRRLGPGILGKPNKWREVGEGTFIRTAVGVGMFSEFKTYAQGRKTDWNLCFLLIPSFLPVYCLETTRWKIFT
jgi:hypothetical protein